MKKMLFALAIIIISLTGFFNFSGQKDDDVVPPVLPPKAVENIPIGEKTDFPISVPAGFSVGVFAKNLSGARDLEFTTGGTLLVSLTSSGKIVALSDSDKDGTGEVKDIATGLDRPHGLAFREGKLYVAEETAVSVYDWNEQTKELSGKKSLFSLPAGGRHFTRTLAFDKSGKLYISVGSTCDVCTEKNPMHGTVLIWDPSADGSAPRIFAKGLRNSVFITLNPDSGEIWGTEMGRDFLGDETPPDEVNIIKDGSDYGWPYCYGQQIYDDEFGQKDSSYCQNTVSPIYKIPAHSAPLGLTFIESEPFPADWAGDLLVAYHGSWNRSVPTGYKVVRMKVDGNKISGEEDFLTGFLSGSQTLTRPVDLIFDKEGSLYVSDDKAGYIFKVVRASE